MALQNLETGEYLRITGVFFKEGSVAHVDYEKYMDKEQRLANDETPYIQKFQSHVNSGLLAEKFNMLADPSISIVDNFKKAGYEAIKADTFEFSNWSDA